MGIARVAAPTVTEQGTGGTTSFVVSMPATVNAGEVLVMGVGGGGGATATPSGWTLITGLQQAASDSIYAFYKVADGSEAGTTPTVTIGAAGRATAIVARYSGVNTSTVLDVAAATGTNAGSGSTVTVAAETTVTDQAFLVSFAVGNAATGLTWTQPSGFSTPVTSTGTGKGTAFADGFVQSPAGSTGTQVWTWSQTALKMDALTFALRPVATTPISGSDTGAGSEAATVAVITIKSSADSGAGSEAASVQITMAISSADSGSASESASIVTQGAVNISDGDSGGFAEVAFVVDITPQYFFTPPQRIMTTRIKGSLRYSYPVSETVWKDADGVWRSMETPPNDLLLEATLLLSVSGRPQPVGADVAAELIAAGIGTIEVLS